MPSKIEDYALIGDCETAALVNREGSIDWLCWPDFSSNACFAALLGTEKNGYWQICPSGEGWKSSRKYRDHTLILETIFESDEGAVRLIDCMPIREHNSDRTSDIVRIVEGIRGTVNVHLTLSLRFDYGRTVPWVNAIEDGIRAIAGPAIVILHSSVPVHGENLHTAADFTVNKGDRVSFTLTWGESHKPDPRPVNAEHALKDTEHFWHHWASQLKYDGLYVDAVERSLITLKALTFRSTGGIVASATTSLPEAIGGPRNWDYRYCWLRDTTFTLLAMTTAGYYDEAAAWQAWLLRAVAGSPDQVQIMYGLKGERQLMEFEVAWLPGYENSRPVRIGNAAAEQVQLDIYGELLDTFFHALHGMGRHTSDDFHVLMLLLEHLETIWQRPDEGIWETRGGKQHFVYSKLMCWVCLDRALRLAEKRSLPAEWGKWIRCRDEIYLDIMKNGFCKKRNAFVQHYGSESLDASNLIMPLVFFVGPNDPRMIGTLDAICRDPSDGGLLSNSLVYRYNLEQFQDGLGGSEGTFNMCTFWLVEALTHAGKVDRGRLDQARLIFEKMLGYTNHLGLFAEETSVHGEALGNFPQAFTHLALISSAYHLDEALGQNNW